MSTTTNTNTTHYTGWFIISLALSSMVWLFFLFVWFDSNPASNLTERIPGMCGEPLTGSLGSNQLQQSETGSSAIGEFFATSDGVPSSIQGKWSRFRGDDFDNINKELIPLKTFANQDTPTILWSAALGEGHAAPIIYNGRVYLLDYDERENADALRCFSLDDGQEIWRRWYSVKIKRNHGMSRTIPAVTDNFLLTIGPRCHVMCTNPISGDLLWSIDLQKEYTTEEPLWYTGQCAYIDDTVAVIAPGGSSLMIGVDCKTGDVLWKTLNKHQWKMSHASIIPMHYGNRKIYLYGAVGGIAGVAADGEDRGSILFENNEFNQSVVAPSPVVLKNGRIFLTAGYGAGSALMQLTENSGAFSIKMIKRFGVKEGLASEQQTPLYHNGHMYGVLPKDAGQYKNQFVCVSDDDPSRIIWSSGPQYQFGLGPYIIADGKFYILSDDGKLTVAAVSSKTFQVLGSVQLMDGVDAWGPMALVNGRLLVRDSKMMLCVDIRNK
jgi:outer membrane protein assembly factor BamB